MEKWVSSDITEEAEESAPEVEEETTETE
jgi:hypothetical protein